MAITTLFPGSSGARLEAEPNVTPFIDVLLVLLLVFFVAYLMQQGITIEIPAPAAAGPQSEPRPPQIVLEIRADGSYALNRQPVPVEHLDAQLRSIYDGRRTKLLFVDAAPERSYQDVITAMDRARGAGVQVIGMLPAGSER
jgi:biopolymer transport protein ExbD